MIQIQFCFIVKKAVEKILQDEGIPFLPEGNGKSWIGTVKAEAF